MAFAKPCGISSPARKILHLQELSCCYFYVKEPMPTEIGFQVWGWKSREFAEPTADPHGGFWPSANTIPLRWTYDVPSLRIGCG